MEAPASGPMARHPSPLSPKAKVGSPISRVLSPGAVLLASVPHVGGLGWELGRKLTSARHFARPEYRERGLDYDRATELGHVNTIWQLERTLRRHFQLDDVLHHPFPLPSSHLNLVSSYRLSKRPR